MINYHNSFDINNTCEDQIDQIAPLEASMRSPKKGKLAIQPYRKDLKDLWILIVFMKK